MTQIEENLPPNFAEKVLELESHIDDHFSMDLLTQLNELYRMAIDYYIRYEPRKAKHFQRKMTKLLADPITLDAIENQTKINHPKLFVTTKLPSKIRQEVHKFENCSDSYIKSILEKSERVLRQNEMLKNMDLNKQEENLQNRINLKKYKSQQKFLKLEPRRS